MQSSYSKTFVSLLIILMLKGELRPNFWFLVFISIFIVTYVVTTTLTHRATSLSNCFKGCALLHVGSNCF